MHQYDIKEFGLKTCSKCKQVKPLDDFSRDRTRSDGRRTRCRDCERAYAREYRQKNTEKVRAYRRERYQKNAEKERAYAREYHQKNAEKKRAYDREYHQKNAGQNPYWGQERKHHLPDGWIANRLRELRGVCAACHEALVGKPHVHHDHQCCPGGYSCGKCVIDLLCYRCNTAEAFIAKNRTPEQIIYAHFRLAEMSAQQLDIKTRQRVVALAEIMLRGLRRLVETGGE